MVPNNWRSSIFTIANTTVNHCQDPTKILDKIFQLISSDIFTHKYQFVGQQSGSTTAVHIGTDKAELMAAGCLHLLLYCTLDWFVSSCSWSTGKNIRNHCTDCTVLVSYSASNQPIHTGLQFESTAVPVLRCCCTAWLSTAGRVRSAGSALLTRRRRWGGAALTGAAAIHRRIVSNQMANINNIH